MAIVFRDARAWVLVICACSASSDATGGGTSASETGSSTTDASSTTMTEASSGSEATSGAETTMVATNDQTGTESVTADSSTTSSPDSSGGEVESSDSGAACPEDEPQHTTPNSALALVDLDCDDPPQSAITILDEATGLDWWTYDGTDPEGGCEPDSVRVEVTDGGPVNVCMFTSGCDATCVQGTPDGPSGCCNLDVVEIQISCAAGDTDDSTSIDILVSDGGVTHCREVAFEYEF